jgi:sugar transferase (PEP-CTERM/EpsH1 system associated)
VDKPDLLFLAHRIPYPPNKGDKIRSLAILTHLVRHYRIHLGCFVDDPADMIHRDALRSILGGECLFLPLVRQKALARALVAGVTGRSLSEGYYYHPKMQAWVRGVLSRRNIAQAIFFSSAMAPYLWAASGLVARRCVFDMVDVDSDKWAQYAAGFSGPKRWVYDLEARRLRRLEIKATEAMGHTVLVSPHEVQTFLHWAPHLINKVHSIGNGVDLAFFDSNRQHDRPFPSGQTPIVMTGAMDYWPNIQGAEWFATKVLPEIVERDRGAIFHVVGANPPKHFLAGVPNVSVTGRVADIRPYLAHAAIVVAPLLISRGVQNKVLEAMAMARPVVASTPASRALAVTAGRELMIADEPGSFARAVIETLLDPGELGMLGRRYVERHHQWDGLMANFSDLLRARPVKPEPLPEWRRFGMAVSG